MDLLLRWAPCRTEAWEDGGSAVQVKRELPGSRAGLTIPWGPASHVTSLSQHCMTPGPSEPSKGTGWSPSCFGTCGEGISLPPKAESFPSISSPHRLWLWLPGMMGCPSPM